MNATHRELYLGLKRLSAYPYEQQKNLFDRLTFDYYLKGRRMPSHIKNLFEEIAAGCPSFKFNPYHDPDNGQFTFGPGGGNDENAINDPPIQPVYPVEEGLALILGGDAVIAAREALGLAEGVEASEGAATATEDTMLTDHGAERLVERGITSEQAQEAIQTSTQTGNVSSQIGKYGTSQQIYTGTNGITVIVETSGRNAGKIITAFRHE